MGTLTVDHHAPVNSARRRLIAGGAAAVIIGMTRPALSAFAPDTPRSLSFLNLHTGETATTAYWANGGYIPEALQTFAQVLRDHRSNETHVMAPGLFDLLHNLQATLETAAPFHVISGYRSPHSNAQLAAASDGVAKHSLHMEGMAIDIRIPGVELANLHKAAMALSGGGVGYYPSSDFVHMDVGRVRYW
jgi:uncharacterized protein YcbK (DUF882 family)